MGDRTPGRFRPTPIKPRLGQPLEGNSRQTTATRKLAGSRWRPVGGDLSSEVKRASARHRPSGYAMAWIVLAVVSVGAFVWAKYIWDPSGTVTPMTTASITSNPVESEKAIRIAWSYSNLRACLGQAGYDTDPMKISVNSAEPSSGFGRATVTLKKVAAFSNSGPSTLDLVWIPTGQSIGELSVFAFASTPSPEFDALLDRVGCPR